MGHKFNYDSAPLTAHGPAISEITFQPSAALPAGQLVCVTRDCEPTANGIPRVGPALAVGRMILPSALVEGGTKGRAMNLLHAWKDQLWQIGGEEAPPRPRLLYGSLNGEEDGSDDDWTDGGVEAVVTMQLETLKNEDTPKEFSQEGAYSKRMNGSRH